MPTGPRETFRAQATAALCGFLAVAAALLREVAAKTEVRTEGDRLLVTACGIGAAVLGAALVVLLVVGWIGRRRERATQRPAEGVRPAEPADRG
jgi:hypothetical protein